MAYEAYDGTPSGASTETQTWWGPAVQSTTNLKAVSLSLRYDKQQRLVEDKQATYRYDAQSFATPDDDDVLLPLDKLVAEPGRWLKMLATGTAPGPHADTHELGGVDQILVESMATTVLDTGTVLAPDGAGGVHFVTGGGGGGGGVPATFNKEMSAIATSSDGDLACATPISATPLGDSYVDVRINGVSVTVGNGNKLASCYFSTDGTVARPWASITAGDYLYWVGSEAGFELSASDEIDFSYDIATL